MTSNDLSRDRQCKFLLELSTTVLYDMIPLKQACAKVNITEMIFCPLTYNGEHGWRMPYGRCGCCHTNFARATPTFCPFISIGHTNFNLLDNHIMFWPHQLWKPSSAHDGRSQKWPDLRSPISRIQDIRFVGTHDFIIFRTFNNFP